MTITALESRDEYTSSAGQLVFNYSFKIYENTNLDVYVTPSGQSANDAADLTTAYVVDPNTIGNPAGGFITFNSPLSSGDLVTIVSNIPYDRTVDYQVNGDFLPTTVNGDNDRQVSQIKQVLTQVGRTLAYPQSLQGASALTFPSPEAGLYLKWKVDLSGLENIDLGGEFLALSGGAMAGAIDMGGYDLPNIGVTYTSRLFLAGSEIIPNRDFTITLAEQITLVDGQVSVTFTNNTLGATFYINSLDADSGLIIGGADYSVDNATNTVTLNNSYPAGTILVMQYFDGDATGSFLLEAHDWGGQQQPVFADLTYAANIDWDADSQVTGVTLTGNANFNAPTNLKNRGYYELWITQDGTGSRVPTFDAAYVAASLPTLSTDAGAVDILSFKSNGTSVVCVGSLLNAF